MKRIFSNLLNDHGTVDDDGTVAFDDGAVYSKNELEVLRNAPKDDIKAVHYVKTLFGGSFEYFGLPHVKQQQVATIVDQTGAVSTVVCAPCVPIAVNETLTMSDGVTESKYTVTEIKVDPKCPNNTGWSTEQYQTLGRIIHHSMAGTAEQKLTAKRDFIALRDNFQNRDSFDRYINDLNAMRVQKGFEPVEVLLDVKNIPEQKLPVNEPAACESPVVSVKPVIVHVKKEETVEQLSLF